jgi:hypothetical protein
MCNFTTGKSAEISSTFFQGHGMYDQTLDAEIQTECGGFTDESVNAPKCRAALAEMNNKVGTFDIYNIYDTCGGNTESTHRSMTHAEMVERMSTHTVVVNDSYSPLYVARGWTEICCFLRAVGVRDIVRRHQCGDRVHGQRAATPPCCWGS